eukprot:TRINITY_DN4012_c0_g1_i2.p1 TRINITY_DN4012_c0_g1~~TRINITY_DN4012_c0_g1_i2.p1  ORF type:complete len:450 (-),score=69.52 TRINITY_DN4012_c0_g1_i2:533-1729(-)
MPRLSSFDEHDITDCEKRVAHRVHRCVFESDPLPVINRRKKSTSAAAILRAREYSTTARQSDIASNMAFDGILERKLFSRPRGRIVAGADIAPRQFEYHPRRGDRMVVGSMGSQLMVLNPENGRETCSTSLSESGGVLGLCWLNLNDDRFVAGCNTGNVSLVDMDNIYDGGDGIICSFDVFPQLTSVHVNCEDQYFLASGFGCNIGLYDLARGEQIACYEDVHERHINVLKFSHSSPHTFCTSSFDGTMKLWDLRDMLHQRPVFTTRSDWGNVMACWSPDDRFILTSAVDNEVRQFHASDGSLAIRYPIATVDSDSNFTRSYYMNDGAYIIVGSCMESTVKILNAKTGQHLRDVYIGYAEGATSRDICTYPAHFMCCTFYVTKYPESYTLFAEQICFL